MYKLFSVQGRRFYYTTRICIVMLLLTVFGCGLSKQEIAAREERREAKRIELVNRQNRLKEAAAHRIDLGEKPPIHVKDPGYSIVNCDYPQPDEDTLGYISLPGEPVICGNSKASESLLAWRAWYCQGEDVSCVIGRWRNNEPTFTKWYGFTEIRLSRYEVYRFSVFDMERENLK